MSKVECVKIGNDYVPILEVYESYSGWYWFITEQSDPNDQDYCFGLVVGFETEAGYIDKREIIELAPQTWKVPKKNWSSISHVHLVEKQEVH